MQINFSSLDDGLFKNFLASTIAAGASVVQDPEFDMDALNVSVSINDCDVDIQKLFTFFRAAETAQGGNGSPPVEQAPPSGEGIFLTSDQVEEIRSHLSQSSSELCSVNDRVSEAFSDAINACAREAQELSDSVEERVTDAGNYYSLCEVTEDAYSGLHGAAEILGIDI